jgi:hypothetical protein
MMKKLLVTAVLTASAAALAAPAHADSGTRVSDTDAARCGENVALLPAFTPVSPLALAAGALAAPACGAQSALDHITG